MADSEKRSDPRPSSLNFLVQLPRKSFECSLCRDVFTEPVTTPCGHSFCKGCLSGHWGEAELCRCPACQKRFAVRPEVSTNAAMEEIAAQMKRRRIPTSGSLGVPGELLCDVCTETKSKALKSCLVCLTSLCEDHLEPHQRVPALMRHKLTEPVEGLERRVCEKHQRLLELFCRDDGACICPLCREGEHRYHQVVSVEQEGAQQREAITSKMANIQVMLEERMEKMKELAAASKMAAEKRNKGVEHCDELYSALMTLVRESHTKVKQNIQEQLRASKQRDEAMTAELQGEVLRLQEMSCELRELSQSEDHLHLLQTLQGLDPLTFSNNWSQLQVDSDPCIQPARRALSHLVHSFQAQLQALTETELAWMRRYKEPVLFDPDTAGCSLVVAESGSCLKYVKDASPNVPSICWRFDGPMVLGTKGFTSGRHYWEVQVGLTTDWDVGVAKQTAPRTGKCALTRAKGFFVLGKRAGDYLVRDGPLNALHLGHKPQNVGVYLDYGQGMVSFYNVDRKQHVHSFTGESFTDKLYPFFHLYSCTAKKSKPLLLNPPL